MGERRRDDDDDDDRRDDAGEEPNLTLQSSPTMQTKQRQEVEVDPVLVRVLADLVEQQLREGGVEMTVPTRASGYFRVSTLEQAQEGFSLAAQEEAISSYVKAQGWELTGVYVDAGRSGKSIAGREGLLTLLADAKAGRFERLIFWKLDRLARSLRDLLRLSDELEAIGVGIVSIRETIDTGTPTGRMMRSILGALGEFERETIVERIELGIAEKARQGRIVGPLSLGYRRDLSGEIVLDEPAPLVAEAFSLYATGEYSLRQLAQWAARAGLRSGGGRLLDRMSIRKILTNVVYTGSVAFHFRRGESSVVPGQHPRLVEPELFDAVQRQLVRRRRAPKGIWFGKRPYLLTGVAVCSHCGAPLVGCRATKRQLRYMRCSTTARIGRAACAQPMVRAELYEAQIGSYFGGMKLPLEYVTAVVGELRRRHQRPGHDADVARLERKIERWRRLYVTGEVDEGRYRREIAPPCASAWPTWSRRPSHWMWSGP